MRWHIIAVAVGCFDFTEKWIRSLWLLEYRLWPVFSNS